MAKYNGHKNWNHWNVSLWINNDEGLYRMALGYVKRYSGSKPDAASKMFDDLKEQGITKTPDGAPYSVTTIRARFALFRVHQPMPIIKRGHLRCSFISLTVKETKMITFENGIDARCREAKEPTVAKFRVKGDEYAYIVIGTQYGYLHTAGGDVRTWKTANGARCAIKRYVPL